MKTVGRALDTFACFLRSGHIHEEATELLRAAEHKLICRKECSNTDTTHATVCTEITTAKQPGRPIVVMPRPCSTSTERALNLIRLTARSLKQLHD